MGNILYFTGRKVPPLISKLPFKTFCIELYAEHIEKDSADVYSLFSTSGLPNLLETDYDFRGPLAMYLKCGFDLNKSIKTHTDAKKNSYTVACAPPKPKQPTTQFLYTVWIVPPRRIL